MGVNHPGSQEGSVSNWEPAHCLVQGAMYGAEIAPRLSALAVARLPLRLRWGEGPVCSRVSSLRLSSGHSGQVLTLSSAARASLFSPCLLVADASVWATSPLGVVVRCVICGFYLFIFFLPVMLPSEIPKLPTDLPVRGFPGV